MKNFDKDYDRPANLPKNAGIMTDKELKEFAFIIKHIHNGYLANKKISYSRDAWVNSLNQAMMFSDLTSAHNVKETICYFFDEDDIEVIQIGEQEILG